ncbi:MAG: class I SAM-dependent methyltransferase [Pseudolysinimonas sp.]
MSIKSGMLTFASQRVPKLSRRVLASSGYTLEPSRLAPDDEYVVWRAETAERQDRAWQPLVDAAKAGNAREDIVALYDALDPLGDIPDLLEVGCGGGYYSEILAHRYPGMHYRGLDISPAMIELARAHYPDRDFVVGSAYELPYGDSSQTVVMDGVALIHMPSWQRAIAEYARVARDRVVLHGLTLAETGATTLFAKYAYGQPSLEYVFARDEIGAACADAGLTLNAVVGGLDYDLGPYLGIPSVSETWVLAVT